MPWIRWSPRRLVALVVVAVAAVVILRVVFAVVAFGAMLAVIGLLVLAALGTQWGRPPPSQVPPGPTQSGPAA